MSSILDAIEVGKLDAELRLVFSNNPDAPALDIARKKGIETAALSHKSIPREHHEQQVLRILKERGELDFIVLAGYMRILSENFLRGFKDERLGIYRVINIHPSLLPAFPGAHAYEDAFAYGVRLSGITVHLVDEKVDHGPILAQECFERLPQDSLDEFKARGLAVEHRLFPQVLQEISKNGIQLLNCTRTQSKYNAEKAVLTSTHGG